MSLRHRFTFLALAALLGAGCTKDVPAPQVPATVALLNAGRELILTAVGQTMQLSAWVLDQDGDTLVGQTITWSSSNPSVATVGATGVVQAVANGTTQVTAHAGVLTSDPLAVTVSQNVAVLQKVIGDAQAAIVGGQLPESLTVQVFDRPLGMTPGAQQATASASVIQFVGDSMPSGDSVVSVTFGATAAALSFADIGAGAYHTCGRTTAGAAFCWGYGGFGQIGNGSMSETPTPQAAAAGLTFDTVSVGGIHTCGLTAGGAAYCWGSDAFGSLGAGAPGPETCIGSDAQAPCSARPLAVAGGLAFVSISTAWGPTCGLTADGSAYCWGDDSYGQLGIGVDTAALVPCTFGPCSRTPLAVAGSLTFTSVGTGILHTCGLTTSGAAYCWGSNIVGQLGIGSDTAPDLCAGGGRPPAVAHHSPSPAA